MTTELLTAREAAAALRFSVSTVSAWALSGHVPSVILRRGQRTVRRDRADPLARPRPRAREGWRQ